MSELISKYNSLDTLLQQQVIQFMDYLLSTRNITKQTNMSAYKEKILKVSEWSDEDIKILNDNKRTFNQWNITEW